MSPGATLSLVNEEPARRLGTVDLYRTGAAAKIVLNRPDRMNAWSTAMSADLLTVLGDLAGDDGVRAVMLTGAGRAFCTGADLKDAAPADGSAPLDTDSILIDWYHPIVTAIREMPKPVISAVNGPAAGAGVSLALAADLVVAKESAYFLLAFVNIGLVSDGGSSLFVPARIGFARFAEMAMLGERLPAREGIGHRPHQRGLGGRRVRGERRGAAHQAQQRPDPLLRGHQAGAEPRAVRQDGRAPGPRGGDPGPARPQQGLRRGHRGLHREAAAAVHRRVRRVLGIP